MTNATHYYLIAGDGHVRGKRAPAPITIDPVNGFLLQYAGASQNPVLNTMVRGGTSGIVGRVTNVTNIGIGQVVLEMTNLSVPSPGETITFDSGGTAVVSPVLSTGFHGSIGTYIPSHYDALFNSFTPTDGVSDTPWWDRNCKVAREIQISGVTGSFVKGDRITTSGGAAFTVLLVSVVGGNLALKVVRASGVFTIGNTVTNTTRTGGGTIAVVGSDPPQGTWVPFHPMPNLAGLGTYFEFIPNGNGTDGIEAGVGPELQIIRKAFEKHGADLVSGNRGTRVMPFSTFDYGAADALLGGVSVQVVKCSGTFPTNWIVGEPVVSGLWQGVVVGFNAANKYLFVQRTNGKNLAAGSVTGSQSGAVATSTGAAVGFQKGSTHWNNLVAEIAAATGASNALYGGAAAYWEKTFLMIWEAELVPFAPNSSPWMTSDDMFAAWVQFITDLRATLRADMPIALWVGDKRSHATSIQQFGIPLALILQDVLRRVAANVHNVSLVNSEGFQGASTAGLPYPSDLVFLRTDDYIELGYRAWRALEFAEIVPAGGDFRPLVLVFTGGQSQMVGNILPLFAQADIDPELYSTAAFPGVSTADPAVFQWNANDASQRWEVFDVVANGNTFFGMGPGTFSGVQVALAQRLKKRFSGDILTSAEIGFIHLPVNASSVFAGSLGAIATWDPQAGGRLTVAVSMTVAAIAGTSLAPQRGRFTATAGVFSEFLVGQQVQVQGSGLGQLGSGGNNNPGTTTSVVYQIAGDGSWVELVGAYVNEAARVFTLAHGPYPLWQKVSDNIGNALTACVTQLRRTPRPTAIIWWNGESDLNTVANYHDALTRVLTGLRTKFAQRVRGEDPLPTVIIQLSRQSPWPVSDADIETMIAAQQAVAAEIGNAVTVNTDKIPLQIGSPPVFPRTQRQHNGIHHTPRGYIMTGYLADAALGTLTGIPAHPAGDAAVDFGTDGGVIGFTGADSFTGSGGSGSDAVVVQSADSGSSSSSAASATAAAAATSPQDIVDQIDQAIAEGGDVGSYTVNGRTVVMRTLGEMLEARRYFEAQRSRQAGIRRTKARFDR